MEQLELAEYQAARIETNNFDLISDRTLGMVREKALNLMTAIVEFFNSALVYFSHNFSCIIPFLTSLSVANMFKVLTQGESGYEKTKVKLVAAVKMYDQSLVDLTVSLLSGKMRSRDRLIRSPIHGIRYAQKGRQIFGAS